MKRFLAIALSILMLCALLAACGDTAPANDATPAPAADSADDGSGDSAASDGEAAVTDSDDVVIKAVHPGNAETFFGLYEEIIRNFEAENPGVRVEFESYPEGYDEVLMTLFAAGDAPDVIRTHAQDLGSRVKSGMLAPITTYFDSAGFGEDLIDVAVARYEDDIYFVDPYFAVLVLYFNKDIFDDAGVAYPTNDWTWQDLLDAANALTAGSGDNATQFGYLNDWHNRLWMCYYWSQGQSLFDDDTSPTAIAFDNQTALDGIRLVADLASSAVGIATEATGTISATDYFTNGMVGMQIDGSWMINVFAEMDDLNFGVALVPRGSSGHGGMSVSAGETMSTATNHPNEAWEYIKTTFNVESSLLFSGFGDQQTANGVPVWFSAYEDPRWNPSDNILMVGEQAQVTTNAQPPFQYAARWMWDIMLPTFQEMIADDLSDRATLDLLITRTQRDILDEMD